MVICICNPASCTAHFNSVMNVWFWLGLWKSQRVGSAALGFTCGQCKKLVVIKSHWFQLDLITTNLLWLETIYMLHPILLYGSSTSQGEHNSWCRWKWQWWNVEGGTLSYFMFYILGNLRLCQRTLNSFSVALWSRFLWWKDCICRSGLLSELGERKLAVVNPGETRPT